MDRGGIEPPTLEPFWGSSACKADVRTAELPAHDRPHMSWFLFYSCVESKLDLGIGFERRVILFLAPAILPIFTTARACRPDHDQFDLTTTKPHAVE